ncbi:DUF1430 domain-containing protein [Periweissella cryptocerci]|uniref:DUF1430 domain-containing protein n=1 Tax=Periweissella cryptocerci TaxID=2506420 RepID=A0A4P6YTF0_9LACO|nr:DUF1430 domain-containing protein [Periweissella cryptocerci]QBO35933.1 DUF1430 domain-containing protein [Periweissella cryptocerci]
MRKMRKTILIILTGVYASLLLLFVNQNAQDIISVTAKPYVITKVDDVSRKNVINQALDDFGREHKVAIVKQFVVPTVGSNPVQKFYTLGNDKQVGKHLVPRQAFATYNQFLTSDLRYPLYFFGKVSPQAIGHELHRLGLTYERQSTDVTWLVGDFLSNNYLYLILGLVLLMLFIVLVVANFQYLRASNIKHLHGVSRLADAWQAFMQDQRLFLVSYGLSLLVVIGSMFVRSQLGSMYPMLLLAGLLLILELGISVLAIVIQVLSHNEKTILAAINGKQQSKLVFTVNWFFKALTEVAVVVVVILVMGNLKTANQVKTELATWHNLPNYYTLSLAAFAGVQHDEGPKDTYKLVNWGNQHGMIVAAYGGGDASNYTDYANGNVLEVNANYLRQNKIVTVDNQRIKLPQDSNITYALIPANLKGRTQELIKKYEYELFFAELHVKNPQMQMKPISIKANQKIFSYDTNGFSLGQYSSQLPNPVILVVSPKSLGGDSDTPNGNWQSILSNQGLIFPNFKQLAKKVAEFGLAPQIGGYVNINDEAAKVYQEVNNKIKLLLLILALLIVLLLLEYQLVNNVYLTTNRQRAAIKRLHGNSLLRIHYHFILLWLGVTIFEGVLLVGVLRAPLSIVASFGGISLAVAGSLFTWQATKDMQKLATTIKGEK